MNIDESRSWRTAIKRKTPSRPIRWLHQQSFLRPQLRGLDYGCGVSVDANFLGYDGYDRYFQPIKPFPDTYDIVLCTYVLNVVNSDTERTILQHINTLLRKGGIAYITVRRDIPKKGTKTQRYVTLPLPVVYQSRSFCIYRMDKTL